jgi:lipopolysaccharide/colanic/teichoic acid biosynthesis glycosyltransferase
MSIVGPRPERPEFVYQFEKEIPGFANRVSIKPGLTGWAQINGGYDITPEEKYMFDMQYINNRNLIMDLVIIFKTIGVVFSGYGAR